MIKYGKLQITENTTHNLGGSIAVHDKNRVLSICEKTNGSFTEILVNMESYLYTVVVDGTEVNRETDERTTCDVYINKTLDEVLAQYESNESLRTWLIALSEV